jgi:hypothetical protein
MRVRVVLEVGFVDSNEETQISGIIDEQESIWAGYDLPNAEAVAIFTACKDLIAKGNGDA